MSHAIAILAVPGVQMLDVCGPLDVFAEANRILKRQVYRPKIIAAGQLVIQASSGVKLTGDMTLTALGEYVPHTFLIAGAPDIESYEPDAASLEAITTLCQRSKRFGSVCSGALLLARTGLLEGKKVTTHWANAARLASQYPGISVETDALCVRDGRVRTAAGVTSGLDLALRLVEEDVGREVAKEVAAQLVMFFRRPVGQTHFMHSNTLSVTGRSALQELQRWVITHLDSVSSVGMMAQHLEMSERHLTRLFNQELNITPGQWLERERVAKVKQLLEHKAVPAKTLALQGGFSSADVMRRVFKRVTGMTPAVYSKLTGKE